MDGLDSGKLRTLRTKKIGDYFPGNETGTTENISSLTDSIEFGEEMLDQFHHDFDLLMKHRKRIQGLAKARTFREWWLANRGSYLTRPVVEEYRRADVSLAEFLDEIHLHYLESENKKKQQSNAVMRFFRKKLGKSRVLMAFAFPICFLIPKLLELAVNLIVLGPGVQMVNSYTQPVITPLAQTVSQKGAQDLAGVASSIQTWLTNRAKLRALSKRMHDTTEKLHSVDFKRLSPEDAQKKWSEFESVYFDLFLSYNQTLPSHLRDGRNFFRDWMVFAPIYISSSISSFSLQYWMHRKEIETLDAKAQNGMLSPSDQRLKRIHQLEMKGAEDRIAGTLASWKLFEWLFPEFPKDSSHLKVRNDIRSSYAVFVRSMRFDVYVRQFATQMESVLRQIDMDFLALDRAAEGRSLQAL